jgi:hypothetical protein
MCLEPHDLVLSKYAAGREKDRGYVRLALRHRLVEVATLMSRVAELPVDDARRSRIRAQIEADAELLR